jgi:hypothetical protein
MCGRFSRGGNARDYAETLGTADLPDLPGSYNIAPSMLILAARVRDGQVEA